MNQLIDDVLRYPHVFDMNGGIAPEVVSEWAARQPVPLPPPLIDVWLAVGGGIMFETEELLEPRVNSGESIDHENLRLHDEGLPLDIIAFHLGLYITGADVKRPGEIALIDPITFATIRRFGSFNEWYESTLRAEYRDRYGID